MMEWFLTIAGILFGGGMLGQLIIFFVKRHDARCSQKRDAYKMLYDKLVKYKSLLDNVILASFKHAYDTISSIEGTNKVLDDGIKEVQCLTKKIRSNIRACSKTEPRNIKCNKSKCNECQVLNARISELFNIMDKEQSSFEQVSQSQNGYWKNNYEQIYNIISDNLSICDILHLTGLKSSKLRLSIIKVDAQTRHLFKMLLTADGYEMDFQMEIYQQLKNIEHSLVLLSKKIS